VQPESRAVKQQQQQQQRCSVGNISNISQGHSESAPDDSTQQKVVKSCISYESVSISPSINLEKHGLL